MSARNDITPYKGHVVLYIIGFFVAVLLLAGTALLASKGTVTGWEHTWFKAANGWPEGWYRTVIAITFLGSMWMGAVSVALAFLARFYRMAERMALSILMGFGLVALTRHIVERPRPEKLFDGVHVRATELGLGFPSVYCAVSTIIMLTLLPYLPWKWRWIVPLVIGLVAVSRLYLGANVPLDVIGGIALGTAVVAFIRILPQSLRVLLRID